MAKAQNYEVREGRTELIIPKTKFIHPFEGPNTYRAVGEGVLGRKLSLPTAEQTANLLHASYCGPESFRENPRVEEVRNIMGNRYFWVFNRNLWTSEGVYVVSDPSATGLSESLSQDELQRRLGEGNDVRFAPKDSYQLGEHTPKSWAKDGFVIATFGEEGAEKTAEIASKFRNYPRTWGLTISKGDKPIQKVSAVLDFGGRLGLDGNCDDNNRYGFASGVSA